MKLYATVTSDRASKGQGGNEYIHITLKDVKQKPVYFIGYWPNGTLVIEDIEKQFELFRIETKGEKKKGECEHFIIKDSYGKEYCQECGTYNNLN